MIVDILKGIGFSLVFVAFPIAIRRYWRRIASNYRRSGQPYKVHRPYASGE